MSFRSFCLVLLLLPMAAWADIRGIDLYARGEFERAISVFRQEVENPRRSDKEKARARIYLAASLFAFGMREDAIRELETLARLYPEQRVDPNRFPPNFVALAEKARATVETEELRKQTEAAKAEQERLAAEAERGRRKADALSQVQQGPDGEVMESAETQGASAFRLRPEVIGFTDGVGLIQGPKRSGGLGLGVSFGSGMLEGTGRWLLGSSTGLELEAGLLFGRGAFQPRVAARATAVLGLRVNPDDANSTRSSGLGLGGSVGGRLALSPRFTALVDLGVEHFFFAEDIPKERYRTFSVVVSAGLGFNLL